jgi:hypothetical protein
MDSSNAADREYSQESDALKACNGSTTISRRRLSVSLTDRLAYFAHIAAVAPRSKHAAFDAQLDTRLPCNVNPSILQACSLELLQHT